MTSEKTGVAARDRTLELLWRHELGEPQGTRGPKQALSVDQVVDAAIALVDEDGIGALSMRRVSDRLGIGAMSLYTYVPGKAELIDLMIDQVIGEIPLRVHEGAVRQRLETLARDDWSHYERHPWFLQVDTSRPPIGPNLSDRYENQLSAVEGVGLSDLEMDSVITLIAGFTAGAARAAFGAGESVRASGQTDEQWWEANLPVLTRVMDGGRYPVSNRVGTTVGVEYNAIADPAAAFEFGLARVLEGLEQFIERTDRPGPREQRRSRARPRVNP